MIRAAVNHAPQRRVAGRRRRTPLLIAAIASSVSLGGSISFHDPAPMDATPRPIAAALATRGLQGVGVSGAMDDLSYRDAWLWQSWRGSAADLQEVFDGWVGGAGLAADDADGGGGFGYRHVAGGLGEQALNGLGG